MLRQQDVFSYIFPIIIVIISRFLILCFYTYCLGIYPTIPGRKKRPEMKIIFLGKASIETIVNRRTQNSDSL